MAEKAPTPPDDQPAVEQVETRTEPVDSLEEALPLLRRPFTPAAVKWKIQASFPKSNPTTGLIVPYIDARQVIERLNAVCGGDWHEGAPKAAEGERAPFEYVPNTTLLLCRLTCFDVTRVDVGEGYAKNPKGLWSDGLKRASVKFGIGVFLYAMPKITLTVASKFVFVKQGERSKKMMFADNGEAQCRLIYRAWLEDQGGIKAFGVPLDHGDAEDAVGDLEVEEADLDAAEAKATEISEEAQEGQQHLRRAIIGDEPGTAPNPEPST